MDKNPVRNWTPNLTAEFDCNRPLPTLTLQRIEKFTYQSRGVWRSYGK